MIHGHSCCEVRTDNFSVICDPWLSGSAYWRSWFNFPAPPDLNKLLNFWSKQDQLFFYITHLHWDHFHGPTLRHILKKCPRNYRFLIPKTPEKRLKEDLKKFVEKDLIFEMVHGRKYNFFSDISFLSYQVGPFISDSIFSISSKNFSVLNLNDAKILNNSMSHLLSLVPRPNYLLRSHSSANDRICFRRLDGSYSHKDFEKTRINYSKEFFKDSFKTKTNFAIPFASNMAHLHKDTFKYNEMLNFSDYVMSDFKEFSSLYKNMDCKLLLPTEKICLDDNKQFLNKKLRMDLFNSDRIDYLKKYQNQLEELLKMQYKKEDSTKLSEKLLKRYFLKIFEFTPFILRKYFGSNIFLMIKSIGEESIFCIDFSKKKLLKSDLIPFHKNNVIIKVNSYVINDVCRNSHWNSLGVSKRLEVLMNPGNKRYIIFNFLCITIETKNFLPIKNILNLRFITIWIRRYREIIDLFVYFISSIIFKKNL